MKRGRPKGQSKDQRSFGPLGDLIRQRRLERQLGLFDVAKACQCSVQFISNIEHGRAPLPWDKVPTLAEFLKIPVDQVQAANLSVRSDFKTFVSGMNGAVANAPSKLAGKIMSAPADLMAAALTVRDKNLSAVIARYQAASPASRKKFFKAAMEWLGPRP